MQTLHQLYRLRTIRMRILLLLVKAGKPITVTARSKTLTVFARSNAGIVNSNTTQGMNVCVPLFCVCVVLCVGRGLATGWSPVLRVVPTVHRFKKLKKRPRSNKRTVESQTDKGWQRNQTERIESAPFGSWHILVLARTLPNGIEKRMCQMACDSVSCLPYTLHTPKRL
jgi:hypothetical protein